MRNNQSNTPFMFVGFIHPVKNVGFHEKIIQGWFFVRHVSILINIFFRCRLLECKNNWKIDGFLSILQPKVEMNIQTCKFWKSVTVSCLRLFFWTKNGLLNADSQKYPKAADFAQYITNNFASKYRRHVFYVNFVYILLISHLILKWMSGASPLCTKCRGGSAEAGDTWCLGCRSLEAASNALKGKWWSSAHRQLGEEVLLDAARNLRGLKQLDQGAQSLSDSLNSKLRKALASGNRGEPSASSGLRPGVKLEPVPEPQQPPRAHRVPLHGSRATEVSPREEASEDFQEEGEEETASEDRRYVHPSTAAKAPPPKPPSPPRRSREGGEEKSFRPEDKRKRGNRPGHRGGAKHQKRYREFAEPGKISHKKLKAEDFANRARSRGVLEGDLWWTNRIGFPLPALWERKLEGQRNTPPNHSTSSLPWIIFGSLRHFRKDAFLSSRWMGRKRRIQRLRSPSLCWTACSLQKASWLLQSSLELPRNGPNPMVLQCWIGRRRKFISAQTSQALAK